METIILAGGCFWCLEAVYRELKGVNSAVSGYIAGQIVNPTYKQVCTGSTGHAEAIKVTFDPEQISLRDLLAVFFASHDPTTLNRQGNDIGTQYRSGVFYTKDSQRDTVRAAIAELNAAAYWSKPIVTEVTAASTFYSAEDYHQDYFANNPNQPYCMVVVAGKVNKVRELFVDKVKDGINA
ncbi:MAG TPA: peptide-methionine (S)-S-oxide reductase MsrA [Methylophilaceae bacterium]